MFKVPIDYQCAILVFHAAPPQCEQLPRNARETARSKASLRRGAGRYTVTNREPNNEREQRDPAIRRMPDPEISQIRITNSARSFYLVTEYLPPLFAVWPSFLQSPEIMIL